VVDTRRVDGSVPDSRTRNSKTSWSIGQGTNYKQSYLLKWCNNTSMRDLHGWCDWSLVSLDLVHFVQNCGKQLCACDDWHTGWVNHSSWQRLRTNVCTASIITLTNENLHMLWCITWLNSHTYCMFVMLSTNTHKDVQITLKLNAFINYNNKKRQNCQTAVLNKWTVCCDCQLPSHFNNIICCQMCLHKSLSNTWLLTINTKLYSPHFGSMYLANVTFSQFKLYEKKSKQ